MTQKGQVTIPAAMRKALGLTSGAKVQFSRQGKKITLEAVNEPAVNTLFGAFKAARGHGIPDIDAALEELRRQRSASPARGKRRK